MCFPLSSLDVDGISVSVYVAGLSLSVVHLLFLCLCVDTFDSSDKFSLRLIGGDNSSGRVEVFYNNEWGTICNDDFDLTDGLVICRLLGFVNVLRLPHWSEFGRGYGPIWVDELECIGNETSIGECQANEWGEHDCSHFEDVSLHCTSKFIACSRCACYACMW